MEPRKQVKLPEAVTGLKMILDLMQLLYVVDGAHSLQTGMAVSERGANLVQRDKFRFFLS